ncbi:MAG: hypothetical protein R6V56_03055 [Lentisphaeria bacterium]
MATKTKTFDCVEMKRQAQKSLHEEYQKRHDEFESYLDFICAKADEFEWVRKQRKKMHVA